ncbi:hypothetical protein GCM10010271_13040 [Streptomyces kurssanovii]|nr:hypothetical protein GCM10010271_13040 [Streptomyces kurssanovii]
MWLQTSAGTWVQVTAIDETRRSQRVHNLTVDGQRTYFVVAGSAAVLVHNDGCPTADALRAAPHPSKVNFPKLDPKKTAADAGGVQAASGYATQVPAGFQRATPTQVQSSFGGYQRTPNGFLDNKEGPGAYYLSHAEKQASTLNPGANSISVNRAMCDDCKCAFQQKAKSLGRRSMCPIRMSSTSSVRTGVGMRWIIRTGCSG